MSFQANNAKHYLTARAGGGPGSFCSADVDSLGAYEKFIAVTQPGGHIALKTQAKGTFLSVQHGK